jgi:2-polyprenyl-3-methyl-5-hydroxy-6-metoxy-1,4-benzoquinol methylase
MSAMDSDLLDKIRQQFDSSPYPRIPLEKSPKDSPNLLYTHNLVTAYYLRNQKVINTEGTLILDAGCGSGYKSLVLAFANPGAKIVGVDISAESIELAKERLKYYGFDNAEFHVLSLENIAELDYEFDYINCDETLYFFSDPSSILRVMKTVLKPHGIIRANLHSLFQRQLYFRTQRLFKLMGLMDSNPEDLEIEIVTETMEALKDNLYIKEKTWGHIRKGENNNEGILANHLLQGDKGYTIPELFDYLTSAGLEFISLLNWRDWDFRDLFKDPSNLPEYLDANLPDITIEQRLHIYELINPIHRLLDFWCGHPEQSHGYVPLGEWDDADWQNAIVHLHPQLNVPRFREGLINTIQNAISLELKNYLSIKNLSVTLDSAAATCLLPLLDQPQSLVALVDRWQACNPIDPITLQPTGYEYAFNFVKRVVMELEALDYLMVES